MLLSNARITRGESIRFYEKDVLLDDHVYSGDIQVTIKVDYVAPGIGIALVSDEGLSASEDRETYLFRIGHSEYSLIRINGAKHEVLVSGSIVNVKPYQKDLELQIKLINNRLHCYVKGKQVLKKYLPYDLTSYMVGYYSNVGNTINSISIASEIPDGWIVNMSNTNGGYVKFSSNKFNFSDCLDKAELEQSKIKLAANNEAKPYYYLKYEKEELEQNNDIVAFVSLSNDDRYSDAEKNLLDKNGRFRLVRDSEISLKFVGTKGTIKNIQITDGENDFYVPTNYNQYDTSCSLIKIKTADVTKIEFTGVIHDVPKGSTKADYGIIRDANELYIPEDYGVDTTGNISYDYLIDVKPGIKKSYVTITESGREISKFTITVGEMLTIFENMDALIDKLVLYKSTGEKVDMIQQNTKIQYVPATIKSPIIVTNDSDVPLDLSSSYRVFKTTDSIRYEFTNVEREIFEPINRLSLTNKPSEKLGTIAVFGILKDADIKEDYLYYSIDREPLNISLYCDMYDIIDENDIYKIDRDNGLIILTDENDYSISSKYKQIIVDYLKTDSYAVNYRHEMGCYELDIACSESTKVYYDGIPNKANKNIISINDYKLINTTLENDKYIVLKGR